MVTYAISPYFATFNLPLLGVKTSEKVFITFGDKIKGFSVPVALFGDVN